MSNTYFKAMSVMGCEIGGITRRSLCRHNCCDGENCVTWLEKQFAKLNEYEEAKADGRLVVLPCKVGDLQEKYRELTKPEPDEAETYTTGYQNGIRNGQAELIAYLLQIDTGTKEAAEKVLPTCNVTKLPCAECNPCCEHRRE